MGDSKPGKALISEQRVDASTGTVTLFMPDLDPAIAASIGLEVEHIAKSDHEASVVFQHQGGQARVTIAGDNITAIALTAIRFMTRKVRIIDPTSIGENQLYANRTDTEAVLNNLRGISDRQNAPHAVTAIKKLIDTLQQVYIG